MWHTLTRNPQRLRLIQAIVLAISGACLYLIVSVFISKLPLKNDFLMQDGSVLGGDFLAFYVGGTIYNSEPEKVYDLLHQKKTRELVMQGSATAIKGELPFVYPPLVAVVFSWLAKLSFPVAFSIWALSGLLITILSFNYMLFSLGIRSAGSYLIGTVTLLGFLPFTMNTILGGQFSWIGMSLCCLIASLLQKKKFLLSGVLFSLSYYKPPLFLLALIILIATQGKKFLTGFTAAGSLLVLLTLLLVGWEGASGYLSLVSRYTYGQKLFENVELPTGQGAGVFALISTFSPSMTVTLLIFVPIFAATAYRLIKTALETNFSPLWYATVWISSIGLSIQCIRYDLAILFPALALLIVESEHLPTRSGRLLLMIVAMMYFEWLGRYLKFSGYTINLSSVLFIPLMLVLLYSLSPQEIRGDER